MIVEEEIWTEEAYEVYILIKEAGLNPNDYFTDDGEIICSEFISIARLDIVSFSYICKYSKKYQNFSYDEQYDSNLKHRIECHEEYYNSSKIRSIEDFNDAVTNSVIDPLEFKNDVKEMFYDHLKETYNDGYILVELDDGLWHLIN